MVVVVINVLIGIGVDVGSITVVLEDTAILVVISMPFPVTISTRGTSVVVDRYLVLLTNSETRLGDVVRTKLFSGIEFESSETGVEAVGTVVAAF